MYTVPRFRARPRARQQALLLLALLVPGHAFSTERRGHQEERRPNVVLILSDDQGAGDFGFAGNDRIRTPHLDAMSRRSALIESFYVTPVCATTRATLMTGRYHLRTGVVHNGFPMRADQVTLAERLRDAGYATGIFGKWHLGEHHPRRAMDQGFEEALTMRGGILGELESAPVGVRYTNPMLEHGAKPIQKRGYATDVFFDAALDWIERVHAQERPFFAYIPTNAPHGPFDDVPREEYRRYREGGFGEDEDELARIYAMITRIDANVGRLFERLGELELLEDTLVLYACDNGPNGARFNGKRRGAKSSVLEGGIRVPLLAHRPGTIEPGRLDELVAAHVDLAPTILAACGVPSEESAFDGRSFLPALRGRPWEPAERTLFFPSHQRADNTRNYAVRAGRWKLVHDDGYHATESARRARAQLFDLGEDPLERKDLARSQPDVVADLEGRYARWLEELAAEVDLEQKKPPIVIGGPREEPVVLTSPVGLASLDDDSIEVEVARAGNYRVQLRFAPLREGGRSFMEVFNQSKKGGGAGRPDLSHESRLLKAGAAKCNYTLRLNPGWLRLDVTIPGGELWQLEFKRL